MIKDKSTYDVFINHDPVMTLTYMTYFSDLPVIKLFLNVLSVIVIIGN